MSSIFSISKHHIQSFEHYHYLLYHLIFLNQREQVPVYYHLIYVLFKLFKTHGTFFNLSTSNLLTSDFKLVKSVFFSKI